MKKNWNTPFPHLWKHQTTETAVSETGKKGNHLPKKKARVFPMQEGEGQRLAKQLWWQCTLMAWGRDQWSELFWLTPRPLSCSGYKNGPYKPVWRSLHSMLQSLGSTSQSFGVRWGVSLWHTLQQRCFSLGCFSFLVAKQRYFIQYQLSWGMYFKGWLVSPV